MDNNQNVTSNEVEIIYPEKEIKWTDDKTVKRFLILFTVISLCLWVLGLIFLPETDRILSIPAYCSVGISLIWLLDKYLFKNIDLIYEFKQKNYNVGFWLLGLFIFISAVISVIS